MILPNSFSLVKQHMLKGYNMKIFLDTADISFIKKWADSGLINGITTNPSHLAKQGGEPKKVVQEICALLPDGDISVEITKKAPEDVYIQAKAIAALADNITVKVPVHEQYVDIIKQLVDDGISINITLIFTLAQSLMMCKLGVAYISPFIGRLDDHGESGIERLAQIRQMIDEYHYPTQLLAASIRTMDHFNEAMLIGADVATLPISVFEKVFEHPLTDAGIKKFDTDWKTLGISQFP
jgi:transaldolase